MKLKLKTARAILEKTREQIAREIGVSVHTIQNWETGKTFPKIKMIPKIEKAYGIKYENIIFFEN